LRLRDGPFHPYLSSTRTMGSKSCQGHIQRGLHR
jgi:hypothetical protein